MTSLSGDYTVIKTKDLTQMKTFTNQLLDAASWSCERCRLFYTNYKHLLAHLYWRHGTESDWCTACGLKQWRHAPHVCHVLPINDADIIEDTSTRFWERESDYCVCGKYVEESSMIGCDGPSCSLQWYHFQCVGIVSPPEGEWLCPDCRNVEKSLDELNAVGIKT